MKALVFIEIDVDYCSLTYGTSPCTASIPTTGAIKCFNSLGTCQDRPNFDNEPVTLRFGKDDQAAYRPREIDVVAESITSISFQPATISLGTDLGLRATLTVNFRDHPYSDTGEGFDKYLADRDYDPFTRGTFWAKFRTRNPFVRGRALRLIRGEVGQAIEAMDIRHYVIESFNGPTPQGAFSIIAKDVLKLADNDRAIAPTPSNGTLVAPIDDNDTEFTLTPSGIGNLEYDASGFLNLGGKEVVSFTRAADVVTIVRAQKGTTAVAHVAGERAQEVLVYSGESGADIIADLLDYAGVDSALIPLSSWQAESDAYLQRVFTADIAEPTGVNKLISELLEQMAAAMWWDDTAQLIRLQILRAIATDAGQFNADNTMAESLDVKEQPNKRLSQVLVYFALSNPLLPLNEPSSYRSVANKFDAEAVAEYGSPAIKKIFSRWIPLGGLSTAERMADIQLARFLVPPRRFMFDVFRNTPTDVILGGGYQLQAQSIQDETGAEILAPVQVVNLLPGPEKFRVEAEEMLFDGVELDDLNDRVIIIDTNAFNVNLRTLHDSLFPEIVDPTGLTLTCIIAEGIKVGSTSTAVPAFDVGDWVADLAITVRVIGRIQGKGGDGGTYVGTYPANIAGRPGGVALYTRYPIDLDVDEGEIFGGAGGGGAGGIGPGNFIAMGGGAAGYNPGLKGETGGAVPGVDGTTEAGGDGGNGGPYPAGDGGDPGEDGEAGTNGPTGVGGAAGVAGAAIDGDSYVTITEGPGDIRGDQVN